MARKRIGDLLIENGTITEEQLKQALDIQRKEGGQIGEIMIRRGIITEENLATTLAIQLHMDYVDLDVLNIPPHLSETVPKNIAKQYGIVPVRSTKDSLFVAMSDPLNYYAVEELRKVTRRRIVPMIATSSAVDRAVQLLYGSEGAARAIEEMRQENAEQASGRDNAAFITNELGVEDSSSAPTVRLVNNIIERAVTERASDIHIEPREEMLGVRLRVDGVLHDVLSIPKESQAAVIARIKTMSGMDVTERRIPQDGRFEVRMKDRNIDLRISTLPTAYGEKIVARLLDKDAAIIGKETLGLRDDDLKKYNRLIHYPNGVLLIVGPTGSGKSTTMYTMIAELNTRDVNLVTLEDPVEYNLDGVNQVQINPKVNMTFANGLRAILRQDPDIVSIGEIRDGETAEIAMRAALTGRFVLSTIHTNDAVGAIERLEDIGVEPYLISSTLRGVISQRLVRRVCPYCREEYQPRQDELDRLGISDPPEKIRFYFGKGCPRCYNMGYKGRIGIFEILSLNQTMRQMIYHRRGRDEIEAYLRQPDSDFVTIHESAMRLLKEGITTSFEVLRVINEDEWSNEFSAGKTTNKQP